MLTPDEQTAFLTAIDSVKAVSKRQLEERTYPDNVMRIIPQLHHKVDELFVQAQAEGRQIACRAGCSFCCHVRVEAKQAEIDYIAQKLHQLPETELTAILVHMEQGFAEKAAFSLSDPLKKLPCVLLKNQQCMIYENRPTVCRKGHSIDVQPCADGASEIPQHLDLILKAEAWIQGVGVACAEMAAQHDSDQPFVSKEFTQALWATLHTS
ncbi:YkgJ family cysteine cluster protein [Undibacterium sp. SXout20W]|uniref:YkgJ family cysteine cluster protein n=1 Tax=Undibacterium sp. SXout20W TaxID=3413051 RepID=UPI003BEFF3DF